MNNNTSITIIDLLLLLSLFGVVFLIFYCRFQWLATQSRDLWATTWRSCIIFSHVDSHSYPIRFRFNWVITPSFYVWLWSSTGCLSAMEIEFSAEADQVQRCASDCCLLGANRSVALLEMIDIELPIPFEFKLRWITLINWSNFNVLCLKLMLIKVCISF